jgi:hypothetical protein
MKIDWLEQVDDPVQHPGAEVPGNPHTGTPLIGFIIATTVIYFAKDILVPVALALVLAVIFAPVATQLERIGGRLVGALLVVIIAISLIVTISYFLTVELTAVAEHVAGYSNNIAHQLTAMKKSTPSSFQHIEQGSGGRGEAATDPFHQHPAKSPDPFFIYSTDESHQSRQATGFGYWWVSDCSGASVLRAV